MNEYKTPGYMKAFYVGFAFFMTLLLLVHIDVITVGDIFTITMVVIIFAMIVFVIKPWQILKTISFKRRRKNSRVIKIGIDIHGMIDYDPEFFAILSKTLVESGHQIHVMTGSEIQPAIIAELRGYGIYWTHLFSISDYYKNKPDIQMWRDERGRPWVDPELWNLAKGLYAQEQNLDIVLDDTEEYGKYFSTSFGFCKIINKAGKRRGPKAVMPTPPGEIIILPEPPQSVDK